MDRQSSALFRNLLEDLSDILPSDIIKELSLMKPVDRWPDITPRQLAALSLAKSFYKKLVDDVSPEADSAALRKFLSVNERCGAWVLDLRDSGDELLFGMLKKHIDRFFYVKQMRPVLSSFDQFLDHARCGPGASIGSVGGDEYTKLFSSKLSYTKSFLYRAYRNYIDRFPEWANAEVIRHAHYGDDNIVTGSRLSFVPKQRDISRVICTEPVLNMYYQLGIASVLERRLRQYFDIDLATQQDLNRELAREGSITGLSFTIDLESASDSMSCRMLREILPSNVYAWFDLTRSPTCTLPSGEQVQMNMISTMGNGFTFPLQTIVFACMVSACYELASLELLPQGNSRKTWGVFGDDIIASTEVHSNMCRLLRILGFTVNAEKSFNKGSFRESCGGDFFRGHPVRGVYIKTLKTSQARAVALNRLHHWSSYTGIFLSKTCRYLFLSLERKNFVPYMENDDAGVKVPFSIVDKMRYDRHTQSIKYIKWEAIPSRIRATSWQGLYRRKRIYNSYGLLLSFLSGCIRSDSISLRQREVKYRTKTTVSPCWDPPRRLLATETSWLRWETAVWLTIKR